MNYKQLLELEGYINLWEVIPEDKHSKLANQIWKALDDGTALCPMSDDEGNESGAIACMGEKVEVETIPVMRERL